MSYQKQNFRDGEVLSAEQLNRMEEGIAKLETNMITAEDLFYPLCLLFDCSKR